MSSQRRAIVFGPTGNVGSIAAVTAQKYDTKIFLAMRDPSKKISEISTELEKAGGFERVRADLDDAASVSAAVKQTGATAAFIYLSHESKDGMRGTLDALRTAGITFIVFLSSFSLKDKIAEVPPEEWIPHRHAQVELNLEKIFGLENFVAIRAGYFATNTLRWTPGILAGEVEVHEIDDAWDYVTPTDMGRVAGTILAKGQMDKQHIVYVHGPKLITQKEAIGIVAKALGKNLEIVSSFDEGKSADTQTLRATSVPLAPYMTGEWYANRWSNYDEGVSNVQKYTGTATTFEEWVNENTARYA